ncbi:MAG: XRE family transcriptional regulator [Actinobacteria bacterium]|nr:XRE family transcriptional regulator [Actinomycetota bacterium]
MATPSDDEHEIGTGEASNSNQTTEHALSFVIARRAREFRTQGSLTVAGLAELTGLSKAMLSKIENAQTSPSLSTLSRLATAFDVPVTAFFRGFDDERDVVLVRGGQGLEIRHERRPHGHRYRLLGSMRGTHRRMEPMLVELLELDEVFPLFQHPGTELIYMLEGVMEYGYGRARYRLEPDDSLQFDGLVGHGPTELIVTPVRFLSIKAYGEIDAAPPGI